MKFLQLFLTAGLLTSCSLGTHQKTRTEGQYYFLDKTEQLIKGETKRSEVESILGGPPFKTMEENGLPVYEYLYVDNKATNCCWVNLTYWSSTNSHHVKIYFDSQDVVKTFEGSNSHKYGFGFGEPEISTDHD